MEPICLVPLHDSIFCLSLYGMWNVWSDNEQDKYFFFTSNMFILSADQHWVSDIRSFIWVFRKSSSSSLRALSFALVLYKSDNRAQMFHRYVSIDVSV